VRPGRAGRALAGALALGVALATGGAAAGPRAGPFHLHDVVVGLSAGAGLGTDAFHSGQSDGKDSRHVVLLPHAQVGLHDPYAAERWHAGRFDLRAEATGLVAVRPSRGFSYGLGLLLRHHWIAGDPWIPYLQLGGGFLDLDVDLRDQSNGFAFQPQGGLGLLVRAHPRWLVDLGLRFVHVSNLYTHGRNFGIDSFQLLVGLSWGVGGPTMQRAAPEAGARRAPRPDGGLDWAASRRSAERGP